MKQNIILILAVLFLSACSSISVDDGVMRTESGEPLNTYYNEETGQEILNVHDPHVHNKILNKELHRHTGVETTLSVATTGNGTEYIINVVSAVGFNVGDYLHIENGDVEPTQSQIISILGNALTLDRKIDLAHPIGTNVDSSILNIASLSGSLVSPVIYWVQPTINETWHLERILFSMVHGSGGDLGLFGDLNVLTNGVIIRVKNNGTYRTFTNWKSNADMKNDVFDVDFDTRSGGGGSYGTSGRGTFMKMGSIVKLDGNTNDRLEILIQDDITDLDLFILKAQGHIEED